MPIYLEERVEEDPEGHVVLTGRFFGEWDSGSGQVPIEDLSFDGVLGWASGRDDRIAIDTHRGRFSAGPVQFEPFPSLPSDLQVELRSGRRRPDADRWLDRSPTEPADWVLGAAVSPDSLDRADRPRQLEVIERVVTRLTELGLTKVGWTADELDAGLDDIDAQHRGAGSPTEFGWFTQHRLAFSITAAGRAPDHRELRERARAAMLEEISAATGTAPYGERAENVAGRWGVTDVYVHPPDYERPDIHTTI